MGRKEDGGIVWTKKLQGKPFCKTSLRIRKEKIYNGKAGETSWLSEKHRNSRGGGGSLLAIR